MVTTFYVSPQNAWKVKTRNFDLKFYIFHRFSEKQFPHHKRNNVCSDRRLKIESPPLPASKKQSKEIHHNLLVDQSTTSKLQLVHRCTRTCKFHSFVHSFNQSSIKD